MECTQFIETPYIPDPNTGSHPRLHVAKLCINNDLSVLCHLFLQRGQWAFQCAVAWRCYLSSFQFQLLSRVKFRLFPTPPILQRSAKREQHLEKGRLISPQLGKSWSCVTLNPTTLHWTQVNKQVTILCKKVECKPPVTESFRERYTLLLPSPADQKSSFLFTGELRKFLIL